MLLATEEAFEADLTREPTGDGTGDLWGEPIGEVRGDCSLAT